MTAIFTLSSKGPARSIQETADMAVAHFLVCEYSQSTMFLGNVQSFPWIVQAFASDESALKRQIEDRLQQHLSHYFDGAQVEVDTSEKVVGDENRLHVVITATVTRNGYAYCVGHEISTYQGAVLRIMKLNN